MISTEDREVSGLESGNDTEEDEAIGTTESENTDSIEDEKEYADNEPELDVQLNERQDTFRVVLRNCAQYCISEVKIAVWSEKNGQDDLKWYSAQKESDNRWIREITLNGLSREYDFLFVSDTHVIVPNQADAPDVLELGTSRIHYFTNSAGMNSEEQFPYWIQYANNYTVKNQMK